MAQGENRQTRGFGQVGSWLFLLMVSASTVLVLVSVYMILAKAPVEGQMGVVQKIFYFHVPSAITMLLHFMVAGVLSLLFLITSKRGFDNWAAACADVGLVFAAMVLISGPLWGYKAWGTAWTGEPRLNLTLLMFLIYLGYDALRRFGGRDLFTLKIAAAISALSVPGLYFIRTAVERWGGNHPPNMKAGGYTDDPDMALAFNLSFAAILVLSITFTILRARMRAAADQIEILWADAQDAGLDEDRDKESL